MTTLLLLLASVGDASVPLSAEAVVYGALGMVIGLVVLAGMARAVRAVTGRRRGRRERRERHRSVWPPM